MKINSNFNFFKTKGCYVGFEVLAAGSKEMAVFALMMEAIQTSETLVNSYQPTRRYNPEDSHRLGFLHDVRYRPR
jgi:hypothetical protein